jgi:hypothetical protein
MSLPYLVYKSSEPALVQAFAASGSAFYPQVDDITYSDMIATGGEMYSSRVKLSFTAKTGNFTRYSMYVPGSLLSEQKYLNSAEQSAVELWLASCDLVKASPK